MLKILWLCVFPDTKYLPFSPKCLNWGSFYHKMEMMTDDVILTPGASEAA